MNCQHTEFWEGSTGHIDTFNNLRNGRLCNLEGCDERRHSLNSASRRSESLARGEIRSRNWFHDRCRAGEVTVGLKSGVDVGGPRDSSWVHGAEFGGLRRCVGSDFGGRSGVSVPALGEAFSERRHCRLDERHELGEHVQSEHVGKR